MTRNDFMNKLKSLLQEMPESEREEALQYYNDYFDDAGIDNEQEVLDSLGSPEEVAASLKADIMGTAEGEFTEKGYNAGSDSKNAVSVVKLNKEEKSEKTGNNTEFGNDAFKKAESAEKNDDSFNKVIIIILCVLASPLIVSILGSLLGAVCGALGAAVGIICALMACGLGLIAAAVVCVIVGIMTMGESVFAGLLIIGVAFILLALGLLGIWLMVGAIYLVKLAIPHIIAGFKKLWAWFIGLFKKGENA